MRRAENGLSPLARGTHLALIFAFSGLRFIPAGAGNTLREPLRRMSYSVYPRWRGEHMQLLPFFYLFSGLSPLARGTQPPEFYTRLPERFIPAGAGNTISILKKKSYLPVYPRWRGEHTMIDLLKLSIPGLSPLARGTLDGDLTVTGLNRFIPAGAGNTGESILAA